MATASVSYSANTAITLDVSSLGTSSTFVAGRESTQIDNTSTLYVDALVHCDGINGHASTAPTIGQYIGVWVWGSGASLGTTAFDVLDGTDSAETLGHVSVLNSMKLAAAPTVTVATANLKYWPPIFSVCQVLGLPVLPKFWGLYVAHNHTGALAASQSGIWNFVGVKYTIA
jgi:hypothetical protein